MIEILGAIAFYRVVANRAAENGRPKALGWLGVGGWLAGEMVGGVVGRLAVGATLTFGDLMAILLVTYVVAVLGGVAAYVVVGLMGPAAGFSGAGWPAAAPAGAPLPGPPAAIPQPQAPPVRRAGYCTDCAANVWVTDAGSCPAGHGPQSIERLYTPGAEPEGMT